MSAIRTREAPTIFLSKGAFDVENKAGLLDIFTKLGVADPRFDRMTDSFSALGCIFEGAKGAGSFAMQLQSMSGVAALIGSDVFADAVACATPRTRERMDVRRVLPLGVGRCRVRWISPNEHPIAQSSDLVDRTIFTKYPYLARALLAAQRIAVRDVWEMNGAETNVRKWADRTSDTSIAALEIVESGSTARGNNLAILEDAAFYPSVAGFDLNTVTTDGYIANPARMSAYDRDAVRNLFFAIESVMREPDRTQIVFSVPTEYIENFNDLTERGPDVAKIETRDGASWSSLMIVIPTDTWPRIIAEIYQRGGTDPVFTHNFQSGVQAGESAVFRAFNELPSSAA